MGKGMSFDNAVDRDERIAGLTYTLYNCGVGRRIAITTNDTTTTLPYYEVNLRFMVGHKQIIRGHTLPGTAPS